jgi:hypothetical protein
MLRRYARRKLLEKPTARHPPVASNGIRGNTWHGCRLFDAQASKEPELDDPHFARVHVAEVSPFAIPGRHSTVASITTQSTDDDVQRVAHASVDRKRTALFQSRGNAGCGHDNPLERAFAGPASES